MGDLPTYGDCIEKRRIECKHYLSLLCEGTCKYAEEMNSLGIGAADSGLVERLNNSQKSQNTQHLNTSRNEE